MNANGKHASPRAKKLGLGLADVFHFSFSSWNFFTLLQQPLRMSLIHCIQQAFHRAKVIENREWKPLRTYLNLGKKEFPNLSVSSQFKPDLNFFCLFTESRTKEPLNRAVCDPDEKWQAPPALHTYLSGCWALRACLFVRVCVNGDFLAANLTG